METAMFSSRWHEMRQDLASKARQLSCHVPSGSREQAPGQHHGLCNLTS
jgi:hypothetical protein